MIAVLILCISALTLLEFFVSYCHSLISQARGLQLSTEALDMTGITARTARGEEFRRLKQLIALCPESGTDASHLRAISVYFSLLAVVRVVVSRAVPAAARWIESECGGCAYAAAVILDQRIAYSRVLIAQQASPRP